MSPAERVGSFKTKLNWNSLIFSSCFFCIWVIRFFLRCLATALNAIKSIFPNFSSEPITPRKTKISFDKLNSYQDWWKFREFSSYQFNFNLFMSVILKKHVQYIIDQQGSKTINWNFGPVLSFVLTSGQKFYIFN